MTRRKIDGVQCLLSADTGKMSFVDRHILCKKLQVGVITAKLWEAQAHRRGEAVKLASAANKADSGHLKRQ